nr:immunoglobulin light chain junction region [Macaca mulatta]
VYYCCSLRSGSTWVF